jgi:hypothetical protein
MVLFALIVLVGGILWGVHRHTEAEQQRVKAGLYVKTVASYAEMLKPGMTRKEVETYLKANNIQFQQMCCVVRGKMKKSWDDLIEIGQEPAPFVCSKHGVYAALVFSDSTPAADKVDPADERDVLQSLSVYHQLEGCM